MMQHSPENILTLYKNLEEKGFKAEEFNDYVGKPLDERIFSYTGTDYKFRWYMEDAVHYRVKFQPYQIETGFDSQPFVAAHKTVIQKVTPWFNNWLAFLGNRLNTDIELKKFRDRSRKTYFDERYFDSDELFPEQDIPSIRMVLQKLIDLIRKDSFLSPDQKVSAINDLNKISSEVDGMTKREVKIALLTFISTYFAEKLLDYGASLLSQAFSTLDSNAVINSLQTLHFLPNIPL